jgi:hypothetical protein
MAFHLQRKAPSFNVQVAQAKMTNVEYLRELVRRPLSDVELQTITHMQYYMHHTRCPVKVSIRTPQDLTNSKESCFMVIDHDEPLFEVSATAHAPKIMTYTAKFILFREQTHICVICYQRTDLEIKSSSKSKFVIFDPHWEWCRWFEGVDYKTCLDVLREALWQFHLYDKPESPTIHDIIAA